MRFLSHILNRRLIRILARSLKSRTLIKRQISLRDFNLFNDGGDQAWIESQEAKDIFNTMKSHELEEKLCEKQTKRLEIAPDAHHKPLQRSFMQMFTTSPLGLGILKAEMRKRDSSVQRNFREALIKDSNAEHPDPLERTRNMIIARFFRLCRNQKSRTVATWTGICNNLSSYFLKFADFKT